MKRLGFATFLASLLASSLTAGAAVLTFDTSFPTPVVESGFTYQNTSTYNPGGMGYLHDDVGGQQSMTFQPVNGAAFNAVSVDMYGYQKLYQVGRSPAPDTKVAFDNFQWNGYQNGTLVASHTGSISGSLWQNYTFDPTFSGLTSLELLLLGPKVAFNYAMFAGGPVASFYCVEWCGGVRFDNLTLNQAVSAVPLPAGVLLLGSALGAGALVGRRRRRQV